MRKYRYDRGGMFGFCNFLFSNIMREIEGNFESKYKNRIKAKRLYF